MTEERIERERARKAIQRRGWKLSKISNDKFPWSVEHQHTHAQLVFGSIADALAEVKMRYNGELMLRKMFRRDAEDDRTPTTSTTRHTSE